jgi:hypothetical protein
MSRRTRIERASGRRYPARRDAGRAAVAAALMWTAGCASLFGIDEPNVVSADGSSDAPGSQVTDADPDMRAADAGSEMRVAADTGGSEMRVADVGPEADAPENEADATGPNLITNGDFSMGMSDWVPKPMADGTLTILPGPPKQLCVAVPSGEMVVLAWTPGVMLSPGATYTFTYSAMATPAVTVDAKVGHSSSPYTADFETQSGSDAISTSFNTFVHSFTAPTSPVETSAGIAFGIPQAGNVGAAETVCFEEVSLVLQN